MLVNLPNTILRLLGLVRTIGRIHDRGSGGAALLSPHFLELFAKLIDCFPARFARGLDVVCVQ